VPDGLNWSGVASGGWSLSWAEWFAGPVCTRTLYYDQGRERWTTRL